MNHTPGPWRTALAVQNNGPNYWAISNKAFGGDNIAAAWLSEEDARLIAAAPELLAQLKSLYKDWQDMRESDGWDGINEDIEAAIQAAEGEHAPRRG